MTNDVPGRAERNRHHWRPRLRFGHKIVALLVLLIGLAQLATVVVVEYATARSVRLQLEHELDVGERVWSRFHEARSRQLLDAVALIGDDFGFRGAVASGDRPTMRSALDNHAARVGADASLLLSPEGRLMAAIAPGEASRQEQALAPLIASARISGFSYGVVEFDDTPYLVALVPMLAPNQIAWLALGMAFGSGPVDDYRALTGLHASVLRPLADGTMQPVATTLPPEAARRLEGLPVSQLAPDAGRSTVLSGAEGDHYARSVTVSVPAAPAVLVLLQSSLREAMGPFAPLRSRILGLSALAALLALLVAGVVARGVSRPVAALAAAAGRIEQGDYSGTVPVAGEDELAQLGATFNRMQHGIALREDRILHQANHDGLTGLPNRTRARALLDAAITEARDGGGCCTVLMLDVDRFKEINDTLGHAFGDDVLRGVASRLRAAAHSTDHVARLGGDEFLVLLPGIGAELALPRALEFAAQLRDPLPLHDTRISLDVSIGVATYPHHAGDAEALLRRVDIAMYAAKEQHLGVALYQPGHDERHLRQLQLMGDLRRSIERNELTVVFQPKLELATRQVRHAEALLRWEHAQLGPVRPDEFIPLAERSGFVLELSRFVLEESVRQCQAWRRSGLDIGVAVNLSAMDLMDADLPDYVYACLRRHELEPVHLILEVTESALMRDVNYAIRVLHRLRAGGVRIAIDDFGTGHSSLAQLRRLPVDELKIDKSFVLQLAHQSEDEVIVRATIDLGHHMGLRVIAEGVEDARSVELLSGYHCDMVQGFHFSPPLRAAEFASWCRRHAEASRMPA